MFVRDPQETYDFDRGGSSSEAALPADAKSTGFSRDGWELWTSVEEDLAVFLVSEDRVERWPEGDRPGCD